MQDPVLQMDTGAPDAPAGRRTQALRLLEEAGVFVSFTVLSAVMLWPLLRDPAHNTTDVGVNDPLLNARFIKEIFDAILRFSHGIMDANIFFPHPAVLATTDPGFGVALLALLFRPFTADYLVLVNLVLFVTFPICAYGTYRLMRELGCGRPAAIIAGTAFAFCFYRFHQLDHVTILQMQWLPLALLFLHRMGRNPTLSNGVGFTVFYILNALGSANIGLYTTPVFPVVAVWVLAGARPGTRVRIFSLMAGSAACAAAVLLPLYAPFITVSKMWGLKRGVPEMESFSARIGNFFSAPSYNWLYGRQMGQHLGNECATFLGATVIALMASAAVLAWTRTPADDPGAAGGSPGRRTALGIASTVRWAGLLAIAVLVIYLSMWMPWAAVILAVYFIADWTRDRLRGERGLQAGRRSLLRLYLLIAVAYVLLSVGPNVIQQGKVLGDGLWRFIMDIPGFGAIRTPARFFMVTAFSAAVIAGIGAQSIIERMATGRMKMTAAAVMFGMVVFESWSAPLPIRLMPSVSDAPEVYRWIAAQQGPGAVLEIPLNKRKPDERHRMYFAMLHGRPIVDAESSFWPPVIRWVGPQSFLNGTAARHLERLAGAGLRFVILRRKEMDANENSAYLRELQKAGATLAETLGDDEVYKFPPAKTPKQFTPDSVMAEIKPPPFVRRGFPLGVDIDFAPRGDDTVFEKKIRKLMLMVAVEDKPNQKTTVRVPVYFAPPLLAPSLAERVRVEVPLPRLPDSFPAVFTLTDEDGRVWAGLSTRLTTGWDSEAHVAGPCTVEAVSSHKVPSGARRVLVRLSNRSGEGWSDDNLKFTVVAPAAQHAASTPVFTAPAGPVAPGAGALLSFDVPAGAREHQMRVGIPGAPPLCEATVPVATE